MKVVADRPAYGPACRRYPRLARGQIRARILCLVLVEQATRSSGKERSGPPAFPSTQSSMHLMHLMHRHAQACTAEIARRRRRFFGGAARMLFVKSR